MSLPATYNFPDGYANNGLRAFSLILKYTGISTYVDLSGSEVNMWLVDALGKVVWKFSSTYGSDTLLTIGDNGIIIFPEIKSWSLPSGNYEYDLQVKDATGFIITYLKGTWNIYNDITKST